MKQVLNVGIGGRSFVIDEDAFDRLSSYLNAFRSKTGMGYQTKEVMDDLFREGCWRKMLVEILDGRKRSLRAWGVELSDLLG